MVTGRQKFLLVLIWGLAVLGGVSPVCAEIAVIGSWGQLGPIAIAYDGDWFAANESGGELLWTFKGNIFDSAGFTQVADIAGFDSEYWLGKVPVAIDKVGNVFVEDPSNSTWSHLGHLAELTGQSPNGDFVDLTSIDSGLRLVAVTGLGDTYIHTYNSSWVYAGNLYSSSGVVPTTNTSLGDLKVLYRK